MPTVDSIVESHNDLLALLPSESPSRAADALSTMVLDWDILMGC
jgi:hypothetical protein